MHAAVGLEGPERRRSFREPTRQKTYHLRGHDFAGAGVLGACGGRAVVAADSERKKSRKEREIRWEKKQQHTYRERGAQAQDFSALRIEVIKQASEVLCFACFEFATRLLAFFPRRICQLGLNLPSAVGASRDPVRNRRRETFSCGPYS